jgi:UPF0176 protein
MSTNQYTVAIYYKYAPLEKPEIELLRQRYLCEKLGLKGRIILAHEGVNGTVEGSTEAIQKYIEHTKENEYFTDIYFKTSSGTGAAFPKLQIRVRDEIVTTKLDFKNEIGPTAGVTGMYLSSEDLHNLIQSKEEFYIIDMRNDFEYAVGHFDNSVLLQGFRNFRDLPKIVNQIEHLKDKKVITVCTSGVRCEKASGFLIHHGFTNVFQLKDGIMEYMQKYPNQDFLGKLFVFDQRIVLGFNLESQEHKIVGKCRICGSKSENLVDFDDNGNRTYGIICRDCVKAGKVILDSHYIQN